MMHWVFEEKIWTTGNLPSSGRKAEREVEREAGRESLRFYIKKGFFFSFLKTQNQNWNFPLKSVGLDFFGNLIRLMLAMRQKIFQWTEEKIKHILTILLFTKKLIVIPVYLTLAETTLARLWYFKF